MGFGPFAVEATIFALRGFAGGGGNRGKVDKIDGSTRVIACACAEPGSGEVH
jgi:hypothetical protein